MAEKKKYRVIELGNIKLLYSSVILSHIHKHGVRVEEVISALEGKTYRRRLKGRNWVYIGKTDSGRFLTIFLYEVGKRQFRLKTARDSTESEKKIYRKLRK